jgi:hypothetical protein
MPDSHRTGAADQAGDRVRGPAGDRVGDHGRHRLWAAHRVLPAWPEEFYGQDLPPGERGERVGARLSRAVVSLAALRARFPFITREEWPLQRKAVPVAPRGVPGPIVQDRNMTLTWTSGAPGRIRTRVPLLRRQPLCPAELQAPAPIVPVRGHVADTERAAGERACGRAYAGSVPVTGPQWRGAGTRRST